MRSSTWKETLKSILDKGDILRSDNDGKHGFQSPGAKSAKSRIRFLRLTPGHATAQVGFCEQHIRCDFVWTKWVILM